CARLYVTWYLEFW
nr:immunoglobulin heavy chain junction region [Macaca mulatta]MOX92853.1 immunoglobulin heavy chain junction region [Macaca mulatta]MOX94913.1 immunoglobulin heavy chain junction region [Macaca mulatta]MOX96051.1 immunoglobulin heavy chain junction region [Macaca mulatta]